jgi:UDP-N-acetyl-2-amino-2-deoxyglucuronate dehydrogenase
MIESEYLKLAHNATNMANFALIGAGGYIAPRHMEAIKDTGNRLVAAYDVIDSVGILDKYDRQTKFFTSAEVFSSFLESAKGTPDEIEYVSICSPNYLHSHHIRIALRHGAHAICEKPLLLSTKEMDPIRELIAATNKQVFPILQLRHHEKIMAIRDTYKDTQKRHVVDVTYVTSRGDWYHQSWKVDPVKSGGIAMNIGIHFFDMMLWIFGDAESSTVTERSETHMKGTMTLERADVTWHLSISDADLPQSARECDATTYRSITIDGEEVEFSAGFTDLHTITYQHILNGTGYTIDDAYPAIELVTSFSS